MTNFVTVTNIKVCLLRSPKSKLTNLVNSFASVPDRGSLDDEMREDADLSLQGRDDEAPDDADDMVASDHESESEFPSPADDQLAAPNDPASSPEPVLKEIQIARAFINGLKFATLDNGFLDEKAVHRLRNPSCRRLTLDDSDEALSIKLYLALGNSSQDTYNKVRDAIISTHLESKILSFDQVKRRGSGTQWRYTNHCCDVSEFMHSLHRPLRSGGVRVLNVMNLVTMRRERTGRPS